MKKIKKLIMLIFVGVLVFSTATMASANERAAINHAGGSPVYINYQGELTDGGGQPFANVAMDMAFELFQSETGGVFDWKETHTSVQTDAEGRFNVILNSTGTAAGDLASLVQGNSELWLQLTIDGETLSPRQRLTSAAYALSAPWSGISGMPSGFADGTDDYGIAGTGMSATGSIMSISPAYRLPQNCTNGQVAEWDNTNSVWICANDDGGSGTYTAGDGLTLTNSEFELKFTAGGIGTLNGSATTVARSDHTHITQSWDASTENGLAVSSDKGTAGSFALKGVTTSTIGAVYGVYGESSSTTGFGVFGNNTATGGFGVYSNGDAKVVGDLIVTGSITAASIPARTVTQYYSIPAVAFFRSPIGSGYTVEVGGVWANSGNGNTAAFFYAPVHLPQGAVVTKLTATYTQGLPLDAYLIAFFLDDLTNGNMADAYNSGTSSASQQTATDTTINYATIDNSANGYYLSFVSYEDVSFKLHNIVIEYTIQVP